MNRLRGRLVQRWRWFKRHGKSPADYGHEQGLKSLVEQYEIMLAEKDEQIARQKAAINNLIEKLKSPSV